MHITFHANQRMNQRGITKEMIDIVLKYGEPQGDKTTLSKNATARLFANLQRQREDLQREMSRLQHQMKVAKKLLDKGGVTVVSDESVTLDETIIITTYNCVPQNKDKRWQTKRKQLGAHNYTERTFKF
ncbi:MAG: DUF4258 domain-containing protein [Nostocaceae cyanobacterium]|nr:DUF4258 domain-containing protein [Nostocaceae cyanobacterium]